MASLLLSRRSMEKTQARASSIAVLALVAGCASAPPRNEPPQQAQLIHAISPPERLGPPQYLPESARVLLRARMAAHAREMSELVSAIMVLQYEPIREHAEQIANDDSLARPITGDATELNAALPEAFFQRQDELKAQSRALAKAAAAMNAFEVATAYGRVSETCVRCHASYRAGR
jgi:cytochrome c556